MVKTTDIAVIRKSAKEFLLQMAEHVEAEASVLVFAFDRAGEMSYSEHEISQMQAAYVGAECIRIATQTQ